MAKDHSSPEQSMGPDALQFFEALRESLIDHLRTESVNELVVVNSN